jgi:hypothetical protein
MNAFHEPEKIRKEATVICFKVLPRHSSRVTEEYHEKSSVVYLMSGRGFAAFCEHGNEHSGMEKKNGNSLTV